MTSPNDGPHMGFIRVALVDQEHRKHTQHQIADIMRRLLTQHYPGVEFLQWPGGLVASVFSNGYYAPIAVELQNDNLEALEEQGKMVASVAQTVGGVRDVREMCIRDRVSSAARRRTSRWPWPWSEGSRHRRCSRCSSCR